MPYYFKNYFLLYFQGFINYKKTYLFLIFSFFFLAFIISPPLEESSASYLRKADSKYFPMPKGFEKRVQFWIDVYSKYSTDQVIIHDLNTFVIYDVIDFSSDIQKDLTTRQKRNKLREFRSKYANILRKIHVKTTTHKALTSEEKRIADLGGKDYLKRSRAI
ncbi:MAG: hypothetical protein HQK84_04680, partial [Nitrospinae bacterium]|nr:hypothetical protein [Nitrospinota bacterium]